MSPASLKKGKIELIRHREHIFYTGQYAEVEVFPVLPKSRARKQKYQPTSEAQAVLNQNAAERKLTRLVHANFTGDDYSVTFTYSEIYEPARYGQVKKDIKNFLRRLRRKYTALNVDLKYIYSIEYSSRFHIHAILNRGLNRDEIEKCWGMGYVNADRLEFSEFGVVDLSRYIQKQSYAYRRWVSSRNLIQPKEREHFILPKKVKAYTEEWNSQAFIEKNFPEYYLVLDESTCYLNTTNGFDYIRLFLCRKDAKLSFYATNMAEYDDRIKRKFKNRDVLPSADDWEQYSLW